MINQPKWCISLNTWIRFHAGENGGLQMQMARVDEHNSFLTTPWEPLAPSSDYLYCQTDGKKDIYYYPEKNCLYRYDGISRLTKAAQVSIAQIDHNGFHWHAVNKHPLNTSLIVNPENAPHSRPLPPGVFQGLLNALADSTAAYKDYLRKFADIPPKAFQSVLISHATTTVSCSNTLILAAQYYPEVVAPILAAIPPEELPAILSLKTPGGGSNALMIAAQFHPEAVASILAAVPPKVLKTILSQTNNNGSNALMIAAQRRSPEAVALILAAIPQEALHAILIQTDFFSGSNALMIAAQRRSPEAVALILAAIPQEALHAILSQTDGRGYNALMLAAQCHPGAVALILAAIPQEALQAILSQTTGYDRSNALMLAAKDNPAAVASILAAIPQEALQTILSQTTTDGSNALMLAAQYHPEAVAPILAAIPQEARETILTEVIKRAKQTNLEAQDITKCDSKEKTNLAAQLEIQISWELIQLAKKTTLFKQLPDSHKEDSRFAVARTLCNELNAQFQQYLDSPTNPQKEQVLLNGFSEALADKKNEILYQHRNPFMRVLQNIVHFIGRLFSLQSSSGQGVLKTDTAKKINTLEHLLTQHSLAKLNPTVDYKAQLKSERDQSGPEEPVSLTI